MVPYMVIDAISNNVIYQVVPKHENLLLKYLVGITTHHYMTTSHISSPAQQSLFISLIINLLSTFKIVHLLEEQRVLY